METAREKVGQRWPCRNSGMVGWQNAKFCGRKSSAGRNVWSGYAKNWKRRAPNWTIGPPTKENAARIHCFIMFSRYGLMNALRSFCQVGWRGESGSYLHLGAKWQFGPGRTGWPNQRLRD